MSREPPAGTQIAFFRKNLTKMDGYCPERAMVAGEEFGLDFMHPLVHAELLYQVIVKGLCFFVERYRENAYRHIYRSPVFGYIHFMATHRRYAFISPYILRFVFSIYANTPQGVECATSCLFSAKCKRLKMPKRYFVLARRKPIRMRR